MSFLQLVFSLDKTFEEIILFWRICHLDIFTDTCLTDIATVLNYKDIKNRLFTTPLVEILSFGANLLTSLCILLRQVLW